ncbi:hypothetical protein Q5752_001793 [Cryptotrichosporon argae]
MASTETPSELANRLHALSVTEDYTSANPYATPPPFNRFTAPFDAATGQYVYYPQMAEPYSPIQQHAHIHAHAQHAFAPTAGYDMPMSPVIPAATYDFADYGGFGTPTAPRNAGVNAHNPYPTPESNRTSSGGFRPSPAARHGPQQGKMGFFGYTDQRTPYWNQGVMQNMGYAQAQQHGRNRGLSSPPAFANAHHRNGQGGYGGGHDNIYGNHYQPHSPVYGNAQAPYAYHGLYSPASPQANGWGFHHGHRPRRSDTGVQRSQKLDDYKLTRTRRGDSSCTLEDLAGYIVEFSGDQHGSRLIQSKLETATPDERQQVFDEVLPNAYQLMTDVFGNYVVQKLFEHGSLPQKAALAKKMEGRVLQLSMQMYGCRVVQKALEHVLVEQREKLVSELEGHYIECVKSSNANHVVQRLLMLDPPQTLLDSFLGNVFELATHPFGCRVLQKSIETLPTKRLRKVLDELHMTVGNLMEDQFGNYVVQSIIMVGPAEDRSKVIARVAGHVQKLSRHKFASNVVEKALEKATVLEKHALIKELIGADEATGTNQIGALLRDAYGNFPVQTALNVADDAQRDELLEIIRGIMPQVRHTPCGRRLETKITQLDSDEFARAIPGAEARATPISNGGSTVAFDTEENKGLYDAADLPAPRTQTLEELLAQTDLSENE